MKMSKNTVKRLLPLILLAVLAAGNRPLPAYAQESEDLLAREAPSAEGEKEDSPSNLEDSISLLEDSYSLLANEDEEDSPSLSEEWDEEDSLPSLEEWDEEDSLPSLEEWEEEGTLSSEEEEQELLVRAEESISDWNLPTSKDPVEAADDEEDIFFASRQIEEASWDGEIALPAATDALVDSFLEAEALPVEAAEEETIFEGMLEIAPLDALVGDDFEEEEEDDEEENMFFYPDGRPKWEDGPYSDALLQGEVIRRESRYGNLVIENGDYLLRAEGKIFSGNAFLRTDFYHEKGGAYYYLDVYAVDRQGFEIPLPLGVLADAQWESDMYFLEAFLEEQDYGPEKSLFVVYPEEDGKVSVYSTFYDEESRSLKFVADRLGPAVLVVYENKDDTPLMESEDFLKTISNAALSLPAEVDWRNAFDIDLQLGEMHVEDGDYYLYGMVDTVLDETGSEGVTVHDMPGEGLYFTTALTWEEWTSIRDGEGNYGAMLYRVPFSCYKDMEKTFGENFKEKRYFALFPSSKGMIYHEAFLKEEMGGFVFQTDQTGDFFLVAVEDKGENYIIDSEAFIKTLQETFSLYRENLSNGEPLDKPLSTIAFHRTWIYFSDNTLFMESLKALKDDIGEDVKVQEGVAWDAGRAYFSLRAANPEGDSFDALRITYSPEEGKLNERFGEGWEKKYTYAIFTHGNADFCFYPVSVLEDGRIRFSTDMFSDFVLVNLSKPLEDLPGMGTTLRSRKISGEYPELEKLLSWLQSLPGYREGSMEVFGGDFPLGDLSTNPSGEADIVDMPILLFDEEDLQNLSVEKVGDDLGDIPEIHLLSAPGPWSEAGTSSIFHPLPGAYGYYTLKGEGFPQKVKVFLEEKSEFDSFWGHGWEERPLYALFVGKSLENGSFSESEEEIQTLIEEGLRAFLCEYDPFTGEASFEPDQEGDFFFVSIQEGETAGEALFQKWARKLIEQIRLQPRGL